MYIFCSTIDYNNCYIMVHTNNVELNEHWSRGLSFSLAPPNGALRIRCADSTHPGQGHKHLFGGQNALCFLATHCFSPRTSSSTNTCHRRSLSFLGTAHLIRKQNFVRLIYSSVKSNRHFLCIALISVPPPPAIIVSVGVVMIASGVREGELER